MSGCQCYQIGGPWISFDPDCPAHGYEAQRLEKEREAEEASREDLIKAQEARIAALEAQVRDLVAAQGGHPAPETPKSSSRPKIG